METTSTANYTNGETRVTTHYWGYRELSAEEIVNVGGGDIGDYADGGDRGYGDGASYSDSGQTFSGVTINGVTYGTTQAVEDALVASGMTRAQAALMCRVECEFTLPTRDDGMSFFNCQNACMRNNGFGL